MHLRFSLFPLFWHLQKHEQLKPTDVNFTIGRNNGKRKTRTTPSFREWLMPSLDDVHGEAREDGHWGSCLATGVGLSRQRGGFLAQKTRGSSGKNGEL